LVTHGGKVIINHQHATCNNSVGLITNQPIDVEPRP